MWVYCSKEEVSDYSGLAESKLKDHFSETVEAMITEHTGEVYGSTQQYTEDYDGDGTDTLFLKHSPVVSVSSLSIDDVNYQSTEYEVYDSGYIRLVGYRGSAIDNALGTYGAVFPIGQNNITVVYTANNSTVPGFVKLAALLMITELALVSERAGVDGSLAVSRASTRAGETVIYPRSTDISGRLRTIMGNTIGDKWKFR